MRPDGFWAKIANASRAGPPLFKIKASPYWLEVLVAAGAQRVAVDDSMTVKFREHRQDLAPQRRVDSIYDRSVVASVIRPRTYAEARSVGERFRNNEPVTMDLRGIADIDAKRLVDFAVGLIFGLRGSINRVESKVFILLPAGMQVVTRADDTASGYGIVVISPDLGDASELGNESGHAAMKHDDDSADDTGDLFDLLHVEL